MTVFSGAAGLVYARHDPAVIAIAKRINKSDLLFMLLCCLLKSALSRKQKDGNLAPVYFCNNSAPMRQKNQKPNGSGNDGSDKDSPSRHILSPSEAFARFFRNFIGQQFDCSIERFSCPNKNDGDQKKNPFDSIKVIMVSSNGNDSRDHEVDHWITFTLDEKKNAAKRVDKINQTPPFFVFHFKSLEV